MAQRGFISEPNFSSAPEVRGNKNRGSIHFFGALTISSKEYTINSFSQSGRLLIGFLDHCFQSGNSSIPELHDHGTGLLVAFTEIPQEDEQLLGNLNLVSIRTDNQILLRTWLKRDDCRHFRLHTIS